MISLLSIIVGALLAVSVVSSPAVNANRSKQDSDLRKRTSCKSNACLLGLISYLPQPLKSLASKDCSSFFRTTIYLTPATITRTVVITVSTSAKPAAAIVTATTIVSTETDSSNILFTITKTESDPTTVATNHITVTSTTVVSLTVYNTATQTVAGNAPVTVYDKRAVNTHIRTPVIYTKRNVAITSTCTPTFVPAYAGACKGTAYYSSACSCLGSIAHITTTASQSTFTATTTSTAYATIPVSPITITAVQSITTTTIVISSQEIDTTLTQYGPLTLTTIDATVDVLQTATVVDSVTVTTTVAPIQTCSFQLTVISGFSVGSFFQNTGQDGFAIFNSAGTTYKLDASNQVVSGDQIWNADLSTYSFIDISSQSQIVSGGYAKLTCSIAMDLTFTCFAGGLNVFYGCDDQFRTFPRISSSVPDGCTQITIQAVPIC